ncbi:uncharacterized protein LOC129597723 [Paramacrobiotus metropolitanus]|uniref:uncharacterized protein LOC129597723 n=1 Tax=Paramacrobiotus metropolitanus TaxID=2943436 RepID=UPI002445CC58|nr:uncharacterized protein LOC129597723 [Paramacrobiotus metropolitanus]XP_055351357.1 uncharacterized protein LOC129597723 [Paramacrobiotus metropolitanus]XP_055351358.1 uncharacterized protein LOC129597723 [Paramacrobiotus metropolitanus]
MPLIRFSNLWRRDKIPIKLLIITLFFLACYLTQYPGQYDVENTAEQEKNSRDQTPDGVACGGKNDQINNSSVSKWILALYKVIGSMERTGVMRSAGTVRPETKQRTVTIFLSSTLGMDVYNEHCIRTLHTLGYVVDVHTALPVINPQPLIKERSDLTLCLFTPCSTEMIDYDAGKVVYISEKLPALILERELLNTVFAEIPGLFNQNVYRHLNTAESMPVNFASNASTNWIVTQEDGSPSFVTVPAISLPYFLGEMHKTQTITGKMLLQESFTVLDRPAWLSVYVVAVGKDPVVYFLHKSGLIQIGEYPMLGSPYQGSSSQLTWSIQQFRKYLLSKYTSLEIERFFQDVRTAVDVFLAHCKLAARHKQPAPLATESPRAEENWPRLHQIHIAQFTIFITKALTPHVVSVAPYPHTDAQFLPNSLLIDLLQFDFLTHGFQESTKSGHLDLLRSVESIECKEIDLENTVLKPDCLSTADLRNALEIVELFRISGSAGMEYIALHSFTQSTFTKAIENFLTCHPKSMDSAGWDLTEFDAGYDADTSTARRSCQQNSLFHSLLFSVAFRPALQLNPLFHPLTTLYSAAVPFDVMSVEVSFEPADCSNFVSILGNTYPAKHSSFTLGVGLNVMHIHVVKQNLSAENSFETLKIYTIKITREPRHSTPVTVEKNKNLEILQNCRLLQACEMRLYPNESCGLQPEINIKRHGRESQCTAKADYWIVPCRDCSNEASCNWDGATWSAEACAYRQSDYVDLSAECLKNKRFIFLGDSTNRGILAYALQLLNGSLWSDEKIHSIKVYTFPEQNVSFSFAYYPQFWIPKNLRPTFKKTVLQATKAIDNLDDSKDVVFVIGGVQFLRPFHLRELDKILRRKNLKRSRVVVKTLGAGFFIRIPGIPFVTQDDLGTLVKHNDELKEEAKRLSYSFVDTLAMTVSRYNEFHPGRCSCHFHSVEQNDSNGQNSRFLLKGPINALYSRQVLRNACAD